MSFVFPALAVLGAAKTGLAIGYKVYDVADTVVVAFTTTGVVESPSVPGNYHVVGGITLTSGFLGRIEWGTAGSKLAEEDIADPAGSGTATVVVAPILASVRRKVLSATVGGVDVNLVCFQNSKDTFEWLVVDGTGARYDMTGHHFRFLCINSEGVVQWVVDETADPGDIVLASSASDSIKDLVAVTIQSTKLATVDTFQYRFWDLTLEAVIGSGLLSVKVAPVTAP